MPNGSRVTISSVCFLAILTLFSCNKGNGGTQTYTGPGSAWSITLNSSSSTFVLTHAPSPGAAVDGTINGTYQTYSTGFLRLTVTSATGSGGTNLPDAGAQANALDVPGFVFFLSPVGAGTNVIPMVVAGTCPTSTLNLDWVQVKPNAGWSVTTDPAAGAFTYDAMSGAANVTAEYLLGSPSSMGTQSLGTGTCSNGVITGVASAGHTSDIFLTSGGGAVVHAATDAEGTGGDGIIFGLHSPSAAISPTTLAGNYSGLVFGIGGGSGGPAIKPVSLVLTASGQSVSGAVHVLTDITSGQTGNAGAAMVINNAGPNNMLTGTIDTTGPNGGGTPQSLTCIVQQNAAGTTQTILACDGTDQSATPAFFNILLISH